MKEPQMAEIAALINDALSAPDDDAHLAGVKERVKQLTSGFSLYPELMSISLRSEFSGSNLWLILT